MRIAIIGAGLAGLSCAHELERYGISPVVYEDLDFIGDREAHISANLNVADRPIKDLLEYYNKTCHLDIKPVNVVKKLTHYSETKKTVIKGKNFGYFFKRGKEEDSVKCQLYSKLRNTDIIFGQKPDLRLLSKDYSHVVVANGRPEITREMGLWKDLINGWVIGAVVEGEFDPNELTMWVNRKYCKNGYAYLCPYDGKRATISLFVPYVSLEEMRYYWKRFYEIERISFKTIEEFVVQHFSGLVDTPKVGNIYIAGTAGGALSPFLGFGQLNSISMGVFAAQSIVEGLDYKKLMKDIINKEQSFYEIRKAYDNLSNKGLDYLVSAIGVPGIKHLVYYTNLNVIKFTGGVLKLKNKLIRK